MRCIIINIFSKINNVVGFLQRASSIYGTGISPVSSSPRAIVATAVGSESLNKILGRSFKLAVATENYLRLTNMLEVESIEARVKGYDAVILGTIYQLEKRPVTGSTYEKSPNDKTLEFYLDNRNLIEPTVSDDDMEIHLSMFQRSVDACKNAGIEHVVVIETPATKDSKPFAKVLDDSGLNFTYIRASGELFNTKLYTFEEGIQHDITMDGFTLGEKHTTKSGYEIGDWSDAFNDETAGSAKDEIPREDLAAVVVQSLMSLDWKVSRCINVSSNGSLVNDEEKTTDEPYVPKKILKSDKDWCLKSDLVAKKMEKLS